MNRLRTRVWRRIAVLAAAAGMVLLAMAGCGGGQTTGSTQGANSLPDTAVPSSAVPSSEEAGTGVGVPMADVQATPTRARATPTPALPERIDGLPVITTDELPPEALDTLALIEQDGPFPFDKDGSVFQNREGILPDRPRGYYREYTVITPWENDRGARRIVAGERGELYYTDDHYDSFSRIMEQ
jgi:ribonuclease T1